MDEFLAKPVIARELSDALDRCRRRTVAWREGLGQGERDGGGMGGGGGSFDHDGGAGEAPKPGVGAVGARGEGGRGGLGDGDAVGDGEGGRSRARQAGGHGDGGAGARPDPARPAGDGDSDVLDFDQFDGLRQVAAKNANPNWLDDLVEAYVADASSLVARLRAAVASPGPALQQAAHSLRGSSGMMGALRLESACTSIEQTAARGEVVDPAVLDDVEFYLGEVAVALLAQVRAFHGASVQGGEPLS